MAIPYPIPEPHRSRLIAAGQAACDYHYPRNKTDRLGYPDFPATASYRDAHSYVEHILAEIQAAFPDETTPLNGKEQS